MHTEIRTFREPLYACGERPSCGSAVPASLRPAHEQWHRDYRQLVELVGRLSKPGDEDVEGVPLQPWEPSPAGEPDVEAAADTGVDGDDWPTDDEVRADDDLVAGSFDDEPVGELRSDELLNRRRFGA